MPKISSEDREIRTVALEKLIGGIVEVYVQPTAGEVQRIVEKSEGEKSFLLALSILIKSWNITDDNDVLLPITVENIGKLTMHDVTLMGGAIDMSYAQSPEKKA